MKSLIMMTAFINIICLPGKVLASSECAGFLEDGTLASVEVTTIGARAQSDEARVKMQKGASLSNYYLQIDTGTQYFEDDDLESNTAIIGLRAYTPEGAPVFIKYVGPNYADQRLIDVLVDSSIAKSPANLFRLWKGGRAPATEQLQVTGVVCKVE